MNFTPTNFPPPVIEDNRCSVGRTFLRQPGLRITEGWFITTGQCYEVSELRSPRTVRGAYDPAVVTTGVLAGAALLAVMLSAHLFYDQPSAWMGVAVVALAPVAWAISAIRLHPRPYELWANYRGVSVRLFGSSDEKTYGHVTRALIRAQESQPVAVSATMPDRPRAA